MALDISWTRTAMKLPDEVRRHIVKMLNELHRYFPEMRRKMTIGITRSYDGLAFQSNEGKVKLMVEVRKTRGRGWRYPSYWTLAHELMHLAQFNGKGIPGGERACDIHALARLPPRFIDESPSYLVVPDAQRKEWTLEDAKLARSLAREAVRRRQDGLRRYAVWWESEFERAKQPSARCRAR